MTELDRIERFIAAYNAIDDVLQRDLATPQTFRGAVDSFAKARPWWRDAETLRVFAALRNFLVHEKTRPYDYPCAPSEGAVRDIEGIRDRLLSPSRIGRAFSREVVTLAPDETLERALRLIEERRGGRFPVYDLGRFVGLLTENGIARWLAGEVTAGRAPDFQTRVTNVLPREKRRDVWRFAPPSLPVLQAAFWFHENTWLETILISSSGREDGALQGIVTRGDVVGWTEETG